MLGSISIPGTRPTGLKCLFTPRLAGVGPESVAPVLISGPVPTLDKLLKEDNLL